MKQLITASINLNKVQQNLLFTGKNGTYLNITIFVSDEADEYGNNVSIQQSTKKGDEKIYLGNGKTYKPQSDKISQPKDDDDLPDFMK